MRRVIILLVLLLVSACSVGGPAASPSSVHPAGALASKLTNSMAEKSVRACGTLFAGDEAVKQLAERLCKLWLGVAERGELEFRADPGRQSSAQVAVIEIVSRFTGESALIVEEVRCTLTDTGSISRIEAPDSLWATQDFAVRQVGSDFVVDAPKDWADALGTARNLLEGQSWPGIQLPKTVVVEFPRSSHVFLTRTKQAGSMDVGAVAAPLGNLGGVRIIVNPLVVRADSQRAAALLAHELVHVYMRNVDSAETPMWLSEGFAEYSSWVVRPAARSEAITLVKKHAISGRPTTADFENPDTLLLAYARAAIEVEKLLTTDGRQTFLAKYAKNAYLE